MWNWCMMVLVGILCCGTVGHSWGQRAFTDAPVALHFDAYPLSEVLEELTSRYDLQFSYANDHLPLQKKITFHSEGRALKPTLAALFESNNIRYAYIGKQVVLKPDKARERKNQKRRRKARRNAREQQTLERGRLFKVDWHTQINKPVVKPAPEREVYTTEPIAPLVVTEIGSTAPLKFEAVTKRPTDEAFKRVVRPRLAQVTLFPPLSTNPRHQQSIHLASLNLFWGNNGGVLGLEIGLLGNRIGRSVQGVQGCIGYNWVKGDVYGVQAAVMLNVNKGDLYGLQLGGGISWNRDCHGLQFSGLNNLSRHLYGLQSSLLSNLATDVYGAQLSGLVNFANGKLFGVQIAGGANLTWGGKSAVQLAGIFNYSATAQFQIAAGFNIAQLIDGAQLGTINAAKRVHGVQLGGVNYTEELEGCQVGLFNVAKNVKGTMVGLINIVDSLKGVPIGLINVVRYNGYNRIELSGSDVLYCSLGAKFGVPRLYYSLQVGWQVNAENEYVWGIGIGVGTAVPLTSRWEFHLEWLTSHLNQDVVWTPELNLLHQLKPMFSYRFSERMSLFLGPTINLLLSKAIDPDTGQAGNSIAPYELWGGTNRQGTHFSGWIGGTIGLRF